MASGESEVQGICAGVRGVRSVTALLLFAGHGPRGCSSSIDNNAHNGHNSPSLAEAPL